METRQDKRPETIQFAVRVWLLLIALEVLRHLVMVVTTALNPAGVADQILAAMNKDQVRQLESMGDAVLNAAIVGYYVIIMLFALAVLGVAAWMVMVVANAKPKAASAVRLLTFFGIYFGVRAVFVFIAPSAMSQPHSVQFLIDGSLQIVIGVGAVVALMLLSRPDSRTWVAS